ncbi:hypothetical protein ABC347_04350 [Sphingomonas sp. 1P06PA]|uniref:hypothetical protein n=1 Tax=Sphingomonas sp. 1P06PA TaxID=554121 RepID=UPI0039A41E5A
MANNGFPEGTDSIITGAGVDDTTNPSFDQTEPSSRTQAAKDKIAEKATDLKGQAADKARTYAVQGKDKATDALDGVSRLVEDAAGQIDEKVGEQYGAYARQAAQAISGLSTTLRNKDIDDLVAEARDAVRKSPALAIGAAAALGFVVARVIKAGADAAQGVADKSLADLDTPPHTSNAPKTTVGSTTDGVVL